MYRQLPLIFMLAICLAWTQPCMAMNGDDLNEETVIYAVALKKVFPDNKFFDKPISFFVIEDRTRIDSYDGPSILKENLRDYLPQISEDTLDNFKSNNTESYPLVNLLNFPFKHVLMKSSEMQGQFPLGSWRTFFEKYKGSPGLVSFSGIGFNKLKDEALVYVARAYGDDGGSGHLLLLKKKKDVWKVKKEMAIWVWVG